MEVFGGVVGAHYIPNTYQSHMPALLVFKVKCEYVGTIPRKKETIIIKVTEMAACTEVRKGSFRDIMNRNNAMH